MAEQANSSLLSVLSLLLQTPGRHSLILDTQHLKALRLTSKAIKDLVEPFLFQKIRVLFDYANTWGLEISLAKTNIMLLSGASPDDDLSTRPIFTIAQQPLNWVHQFIYLGVTFHETMNMDALMAESRILKGRTAQALTRYHCSRLGLTNPGVQISLLNALVRSTMEYSIEIWGPDYLNTATAMNGNDPAEALHRHFLRRLMGVRPNTPNLRGLKFSYDLKAKNLEILTSAPFLETLRELELAFQHPNPNKLSVPLSSLLLNARRLKKFTLNRGPAFQIGDSTSIEEINIWGCTDPDNLVLPRSLVRLEISACKFSSAAAMRAVVNSANLPHLVTLEIKHSYIHKQGDWTDFMRHLDLPTLEDLTISSCEEFTGNDAFWIAEGASRQPQLKKYRVHPFHRHVNSLEVRKFAASPRAAKLEELQLQMDFGDGGVKELAANAANMPHLKCLCIRVHTVGDVQSIAEAGRNGYWPLLEKLELNYSIWRQSNWRVGQPEEMRPLAELDNPYAYCKELLDPIFGPGLEFSVL